MKKLIFLYLILLTSQLVTAQKQDIYNQIISIKPEERICFTLYTVHENILKLTAQFYPLKNFEPFEATLEIEVDGNWVACTKARILYPGYIATFRVEGWDDTQEKKYRVVHNDKAFYEGIIKKNPIEKEQFVMAAFSCNSVYPAHGGDISKSDIIQNVKNIKPDLLFFAGDQVYDHSEHYVYWLKFGQDFGEITRNIPTICLTDDHDIGQGNLWGNGGTQADARNGISGGYYMPAEYVKEVERAQTSHLPDPYDPTPIAQGIGVYYTDLKWGGLSFAIIEDRKFKSGLLDLPKFEPEIFSEGPLDAIFDPEVDTRKLDIPGVELLGKRQIDFLENWTTDWKNAEMKSVLSQTIFAMANNYTGKHDREIIADFDTNGWPQSGRNKALSVIRKSYSSMIGGDQHLATVIQHGIDEWKDAGYSFCVPAIANYWMRWWDPKSPGLNRKPNSPNYTGDFLDGFQNKITVNAVGNPSAEDINNGGKLSTRVAGYGIVRYNKKVRTTTFECWPRNVDVTSGDGNQYPGWPITISQMDNFNPEKSFALPVLEISEPNQVVTVRHSFTREVVSSLRISGYIYQPKVLAEGSYHIEVGEGASKKMLYSIISKKKNSEKIHVRLL